jgi:hypothetical protein
MSTYGKSILQGLEKSITIPVRSGRGWIDARASAIVRPLLERRCHAYTPRRGLHVSAKEMMHATGQDGQLIVPVGLVPRVVDALRARGWHVRVDDPTDLNELRQSPKSRMVPRAIARQQAEFIAASPNQWEKVLLAAVLGRLNGQILLQHAADASVVAALIADCFSESGIAVACRNNATAAIVFNKIAQNSSRPVSLFPQLPWELGMPRYFMVGPMTVGQLAGAHDFQIHLFIGIEAATAQETLDHARDNPSVARYCLRSVGDRLSAGQRLRLEAVCGPVIYSQQRVTCPRSDVQVAFVPFSGNRRSRRPKNPLEAKHREVWHCDGRNDLVSQLARDLCDGTLSPFPAQHDHQSLPAVAILVESPEHAQVLHARLADWRIVAFDPNSFITDSAGHQSIVTFAAADRAGVEADVVIRADGDRGWPIDRTPREVFQPASGRVLLVDIDERSPPGAAKRAHSRLAAYAGLGWTIIEGVISGAGNDRVKATE